MLFFLNIFVVLIIQMNFLIAIVSSSYDRIVSQTTKYMYHNKTELNEEYYLQMDFVKNIIES